MVDEDSHLTDLTMKKVIQQFYWLIKLFGFNWGQSCLATLVTLQNCPEMLRNHSLSFLVQFAYFSIRPKKFLFFQATFVTNSNFWLFFEQRLRNSGKLFGNLEQLVESPKHDSEAFWSFFFLLKTMPGVVKNLQFCPQSLGVMTEFLYIERGLL